MRVELHTGNGYLPEQLLGSNINTRTDEYGGTHEKRCKFVLELMDGLAESVGEENLAIRLSPFGLFNQNCSGRRIKTWSYLCPKLKEVHPKLSYVGFIEPVSGFPLALLSSASPYFHAVSPSQHLIRFSHPKALRAEFNLHRKSHRPPILGSRRRGLIHLPCHIRLNPNLLRRRLERHEFVGCHRVR
jgi:NADH:flavin oxidoreductase / NADH oxidase family